MTAQDKSAALEAAIANLRRQYGPSAVWPLGTAERVEVETIPSGSLAVDLALGIGGFPRGRIVEIFGPESGGKTTLGLHAIANAQRMGGGVAAFIDAEHALDPAYAKNLGVDTDNLLVSQPDNGEQALEIADALIASGGIAVIVVDSVAALVPKAELEGQMGEAQMGLQARLMSQALRKLAASVARTKTCLVFINQIRDKIGVMFGSPETTTGGRALKFWASVRIDIRRTQTVKTGDVKTANEVRVKVVKNKLAAPFREAEIELVFGEGISNERDLLMLGAEHGLVEKTGAWYSYGGHRLGQGADGARRTLKEHPEAARSLEAELRARLFPKEPAQ